MTPYHWFLIALLALNVVGLFCLSRLSRRVQATLRELESTLDAAEEVSRGPR